MSISPSSNHPITVITYGTYDLLHHGHVRLLERAKALGDRLIVGVTSDAFDKERGKLNVVQNALERAKAIESLGIADEVIIEEFQGQKIADIKRFDVDIFAIGSDWEGKFDYLNKYCKVVYLERTAGVSSTGLRKERSGKAVNLAIWGDNYLSYRLIDEVSHVTGVEVTSLVGFDDDIICPDCHEGTLLHPEIERCASPEESLLRNSESESQGLSAVYISASMRYRADLIKKALEAGCHVLCESPLSTSVQEVKELFELAQSKNLVLMEAIKTQFFPAYERLILGLESGVIGEVKDINASFSHTFATLDTSDAYQGAVYDMAGYITQPIVSLLGSNPDDVRMNIIEKDGFCSWAKIDLYYPTATATLRIGRGIKTEGDMTITGETGYIYVPAPWWLTDYYELRGEDMRLTKRYYSQYMGTGQRYEVARFLEFIKSGMLEHQRAQAYEEACLPALIVEEYHTQKAKQLTGGRYTFGGGETCTDR